MIIRIDEIGRDSLDDAAILLAGIEKGFDKAVRSAMQRAVSTLRSKAADKIKEEYDLTTAAIRAEQNISVRYSYAAGAGISAMITFSGAKLPLYRYGGTSPVQPTPNLQKVVSVPVNGRFRKVHPGVAAAGHQKKSTSPYRFNDAFIARMKSGHTGIFERSGGKSESGSDAIEEIMGSSVPQMLGNDTVSENLAKEVMDKFDERLDHEVLALLNGWR